MPKIDPHTGCVVMTQGEFWAAEAASEGRGREAHELVEEFYADMDADLKAEEDRLRDPTVALEQLRRVCQEVLDSDESIEMPLVVLEVLEAKVSCSFRSNSSYIRARAQHKNGEGVITMTETSFSGSWSEPPDYEVNVEWCRES